MKEINNKETELSNLQQKINELLKQNEGKEDALEKLKAEFAKEREELNNKLEDLKKRLIIVLGAWGLDIFPILIKGCRRCRMNIWKRKSIMRKMQLCRNNRFFYKKIFIDFFIR